MVNDVFKTAVGSGRKVRQTAERSEAVSPFGELFAYLTIVTHLSHNLKVVKEWSD